MTTKANVEKLLIFLAICLSVAAITISYKSGMMVAYNDAASHLNIARRITDSLTPGLVQIGSVWLPLLHLALLPFTSNFFLWQSGLAGAIVSGVSFVMAVVFLYELLFASTKRVLPAALGTLVFMTNLNALYMQSTAMFEPLLMTTALGAVYFLSKWLKTKMPNFLILTAFFTMLATLTRYDGWALLAAIGAYVVVIAAIYRRKSFSGTVIIFATLAGFGILLWLGYNQLFFGHPLYFASGEFSAKAQQDVLVAKGELPTKGNLELSFLMYTLASAFNTGVLMIIAGFAGLLLYIKENWKRPKSWYPLLLVVPFTFNILTLYLGQSVLRLPMFGPVFNTYFNARYGLLMLPAVAYFVGYLFGRKKIGAVFTLILIASQTFLFLRPDIFKSFDHEVGIITTQDTFSSINKSTADVAKFFNRSYRGGLIFVSSATSDSLIYRIGVPLSNFISEGNGHFWDESLKNPTTYAHWIVFYNDYGDVVGQAMKNSTLLAKEYQLAYKNEVYQVWQKRN